MPFIFNKSLMFDLPLCYIATTTHRKLFFNKTLLSFNWIYIFFIFIVVVIHSCTKKRNNYTLKKVVLYAVFAIGHHYVLGDWDLAKDARRLCKKALQKSKRHRWRSSALE